jgi:L-fuculose-phosphate aldolase
LSTQQEIRDAIALVARRMLAEGLLAGSSGNLSVRLIDGRVAITPAAVPYDEMDGDDIVVIGGTGVAARGDRRPSSEYRLHLSVYAARVDVGAVVHTHSPFATAFAAAREPIPAVHYVIAPLLDGRSDRIRVAPYATFGTQELADACVATLGVDNAVLLASHGAVAVGADLPMAVDRARTIEELAALSWRARALGGANVIDRAELGRVREQLRIRAGEEEISPSA